MRISDWSSDVCSSDLRRLRDPCPPGGEPAARRPGRQGGSPERVNLFQRSHRITPTVAASMTATCSRQSPSGDPPAATDGFEIGRAAGRERVGQYVSISVVAGSFKKKNNSTKTE